VVVVFPAVIYEYIKSKKQEEAKQSPFFLLTSAGTLSADAGLKR